MINKVEPLYAMTGFGLLGVVSFTLNVALSALLHEGFGAAEELSFAVSLAVVFAVNFVACRHLIFRSAHGDLVRQLTAFAMSSLAFRGIEYVAFLLLHTVIGIHYLVAISFVLGASMISKFFFYRSNVFVGDDDSSRT